MCIYFPQRISVLVCNVYLYLSKNKHQNQARVFFFHATNCIGSLKSQDPNIRGSSQTNCHFKNKEEAGFCKLYVMMLFLHSKQPRQCLNQLQFSSSPLVAPLILEIKLESCYSSKRDHLPKANSKALPRITVTRLVSNE